MKNIMLLILCFSFLKNIDAQKWDWTQTFESSTDVFSSDVAANDNFVVAVGSVSASVKFGTGDGIIPSGVGGEDAFVAKYNTDGTLLWVRRIGSTLNDRAFSVKIDSENNTILAGQFCGTMVVDGVTLISNGAVNGSTCISNFFILKLDENGIAIWGKSGGTTDEFSRAFAITVDAQDDIYVTGELGGSILFVGDAIGEAGKRIGFLAKYGKWGNEIWANDFPDDSNSLGLGVAVASDGTVAVTGGFKRNLVLGDSIFVGNSPTWADYFVASFNPVGEFLWASTGSGAYRDQGNGLVFDEANNLYVTGSFANDFVLSDRTLNSLGTGSSAGVANSGRDVFLIKYNNLGEIGWVETIGNPGLQLVYSLSLMNKEELVLSLAAADDLQLGNTVSSGFGGLDALLVSYDLDGEFLWSKRTGGIDNDYGNAFTVTNEGFGYATGSFRGEVDFDKNKVSSKSRSDGFLSKLLPRIQATASVDSAIICQGSELTFSANSIELGIQYLWEFEGGTPEIASDPNPTVKYKVPGIYDIRLTVFNSIDSIFFSFENYVEVKANPIIDLGKDTTICLDESILLSVEQQYSNYFWNTGETMSTIIADANLEYVLEVTDDFGCKDRDSIKLIIQPRPDINLGVDTTLCVGDTLFVGSNGNFSNYLWSNGSANEEILISSADSYSLTVTDFIGCLWSDTINIAYENCPPTGVNSWGLENEIILYPNPATDEIIIRVPSELLIEKPQYSLYNVFGAKIIETKYVTGLNYRLDIRGISKGSYFLKINMRSQILWRKFIVE